MIQEMGSLMEAQEEVLLLTLTKDNKEKNLQESLLGIYNFQY